MKDVNTMALFVALRQLGGSVTVRPEDALSAETGRHELRVLRMENPSRILVELVDLDAPIDVTVTSVQDIAPDASPASITCPTCRRVSHHPEDVKNRWCGVCGEHPTLALAGPGARG